MWTDTPLRMWQAYSYYFRTDRNGAALDGDIGWQVEETEHLVFEFLFCFSHKNLLELKMFLIHREHRLI